MNIKKKIFLLFTDPGLLCFYVIILLTLVCAFFSETIRERVEYLVQSVLLVTIYILVFLEINPIKLYKEAMTRLEQEGIRELTIANKSFSWRGYSKLLAVNDYIKSKFPNYTGVLKYDTRRIFSVVFSNWYFTLGLILCLQLYVVILFFPETKSQLWMMVIVWLIWLVGVCFLIATQAGGSSWYTYRQTMISLMLNNGSNLRDLLLAKNRPYCYQIGVYYAIYDFKKNVEKEPLL